eukprot:CAMPEP_0196692016 /NCGR_PEP_ID=MMETSP1090-20130531/26047_1 /TAXON_ID=37098 /ORGANISM="Isochrysis sp, Strain CCMP1244" /LENGTH=82 /DNA_ID=CAMNT_0042031335 /DNA_START=54 /DNA_END=300 /DNA_ORIENTATION=+
MPIEQALEGEPQVAVLRAKDGARRLTVSSLVCAWSFSLLIEARKAENCSYDSRSRAARKNSLPSSVGVGSGGGGGAARGGDL